MTPPLPAKRLLEKQLSDWPLAAANFAALSGVATRHCGTCGTLVQFNPARAISTGARVDAGAIKERPCFLCRHNRPPEQEACLDFKGYELLVNPFPIFAEHFTIAAREHTPQRISGREADLFSLAEAMPGYAVFYNGARCGASAPDHMHFQAVPQSALPYFSNNRFPFKVFTFRAATPRECLRKLTDILKITRLLPGQPATGEPMVNIIAAAEYGGNVRITVIPRRAHRPDFYGSAPGQMLVSPASVDLGGVIVTPREEDFRNITPTIINDLFRQVCYPADSAVMAEEPVITVGITEAPEVDFTLNGKFTEGILLDGSRIFRPLDASASFTLGNVTIGRQFHWQRTERQTFRGALQLLRTPQGTTVAINHIHLEEYLLSVISSEMSASSSPALLRSHAIVSRSWLLAMLARRGGADLTRHEIPGNPPEITAWHDRAEHSLFDVCADDHCQRYQGITRQTSPAVGEAVAATRGEVLSFGGCICDARFSKCCGGRTELFESCWEDVPHPYLPTVIDRPAPDAEDFCNTSDPLIITQVLNSYDRERPDFYRWTVHIGQDALQKRLKEMTGLDFGQVTALTPLSRGKSGRITRLLIRGSRQSLILGKELEIRLALSKECLRSSAFDAEPDGSGGFLLHGRGWGHGVGMCQIGAAVMGHKGYSHTEILSHYFPETTITKLYD